MSLMPVQNIGNPSLSGELLSATTDQTHMQYKALIFGHKSSYPRKFIVTYAFILGCLLIATEHICEQ